MNEIMNTINIFINRQPMTEQEIIEKINGACEVSQIRHAIREMADHGYIHYDSEGKIYPAVR